VTPEAVANTAWFDKRHLTKEGFQANKSWIGELRSTTYDDGRTVVESVEADGMT